MNKKQENKMVLDSKYKDYLKRFKKHYKKYGGIVLMSFEEWLENQEAFYGLDLNLDHYNDDMTFKD